jgi:peptidoglycan/LPS O-acetylase OafA/YrhL
MADSAHRIHLNGLQVIRGIAALAVVLYHEQGFLHAAVPASPTWWFTALFRSGYAGVDVFFVLSGFLIVYVHYDDIGLAPRVADYLWRRASRIYLFYWILCLFFIPAVFVAPALFTNSGKQEILGLVSSVLLLPQPGIPLLGVTWSLQHELYFYAIFALVIAAPRTAGTVAVAVLGGTLAAQFSRTPVVFPWSFIFSFRNLQFALGVAVALVIKRSRLRPNWRTLLVLGSTLFCGTALLDDYSLVPFVPVRNMCLYGMGACLIVWAVVLRDLSTRNTKPVAMLVGLGEASYAVYLLHYPALVALHRLSSLWSGSVVVPQPVVLVVNTGIALSIGVAAHVMVERRVLRWARGFGGRRFAIGTGLAPASRCSQEVALTGGPIARISRRLRLSIVRRRDRRRKPCRVPSGPSGGTYPAETGTKAGSPLPCISEGERDSRSC